MAITVRVIQPDLIEKGLVLRWFLPEIEYYLFKWCVCILIVMIGSQGFIVPQLSAHNISIFFSPEIITH